MPRAVRRILGLLTLVPIAQEAMAHALTWSRPMAFSAHLQALAGFQTAATGLSLILVLVYAGHAAAARDHSVGWRLGWGAANLAPLAQVVTTSSAASAIYFFEATTGRSIFGDRGGDGIANPFLMIGYPLSRREPGFVLVTVVALAVPLVYWFRHVWQPRSGNEGAVRAPLTAAPPRASSRPR